MLQVVAGVVFSQRGHVVENLAVSHDSLEPDAVGMHGVKFDEVNATGVSCQVSSDHARALSAEIDGHDVTSITGVLLTVGKDDSSLCRQNSVRFIEVHNVVHSACAQNDFIVNGSRATN